SKQVEAPTPPCCRQSGGDQSAVEVIDELGALAVRQSGEPCRFSDADLGEDPGDAGGAVAGDRTKQLRDLQIGGVVRRLQEDAPYLRGASRQVGLELRLGRPDLVRLR